MLSLNFRIDQAGFLLDENGRCLMTTKLLEIRKSYIRLGFDFRVSDIFVRDDHIWLPEAERKPRRIPIQVGDCIDQPVDIVR